MSTDLPSSISDVVWGRTPVVGDTVYIDFGDSVNAHPEVEGTVVSLTERGVTLRGTRRFDWAEIVHIEVTS